MKKDVDYTWFDDEKWRFLDALRNDWWFKKQVQDILMVDDWPRNINEMIRDEVNLVCPDEESIITSLRDEVIEAVTTKITERTIGGITEKINLFEIKDLVIKRLLSEKNHMINEIIAEVSSSCLTESEREELARLVQQEMIKQRSHRVDLLDLDDYEWVLKEK